MVKSLTPRLGLSQWSSDTDEHGGRTRVNADHQRLEDLVAVWAGQGLLSGRPAAGVSGRFYLATNAGDGGQLSIDAGDKWLDLSVLGGGGPGANVVIESAPSEGVSQRGARADHTHNLPLATPDQHGAMASQDKDLLDSTSSGGDPWSLALRDGSGRLRLGADALNDMDAVTRRQLSSVGTWDDVANTTVRRGADRTFYVADPSKAAHPATMRYVDGKTWDAGRITSGVINSDRVWGSTHAANTAWGGSGVIKSVHVTGGGEFCYYSSTIRHKTNVEPYSRTVETLLGPEPVEFDRLDPETGEPTGVHDQGFIAEQAGQYLPELVYYDEDGRVEGFNYDGLVAGFQKLHRHHGAQAAAQEKRIRHLESTVADLVNIVNDLTEQAEQ